ncbi:ATP-binding protein [Oleiharenicola lentus]|nr:ATP-binding protein [Oleiharenicola lentus]
MVWAVFIFTLLQIIVWHRVPLASRVPVSLVLEAILVVGVGAQFLALNRLSAAGSGTLFVLWLGAIDVIAWVQAGPQMGVGIALVCTVLVALFFINKRAGAAVVIALGLLIVVHVWLVQRGVLAAYPTSLGRPLTAQELLLNGLIPFATLAVCYVCFAMIHHALFRTLARVVEERRNRDLADAGRRQAEDTMRANQHFEALGKLSSGVAHDVNNALTVILCNAELLSQSLPPGDDRQGAADILSAARSAAQTTRHLLSLSRRAFCVPVSLDPAAELKTACRLAARLLPEGIWISTENRGQRRLLADPADLQQALLNLLINARDAMPRGGAITLAHEDVTLPDGRPGVAVRVKDTGTGIPADVQPRIFDPFFTTKAPGQGTGLGLPMVKAFVEEAGGTIELQSAPDRGTTISLLFPECPVLPAGHNTNHAPPPAGERLLLIEDRDDLRQLLERALRRGGYHVTACASSEEAIAEFDSGARFAVLCTDGFGGNTSVNTVIDRFRADQPSAPVLLFSGHADHEITAVGLDTLKVELLRKPFTGAELLSRLAALPRT